MISIFWPENSDDGNDDNNYDKYDDDDDDYDITHLFEKTSKPSMPLLPSSCNSKGFDGVPPLNKKVIYLFILFTGITNEIVHKAAFCGLVLVLRF